MKRPSQIVWITSNWSLSTMAKAPAIPSPIERAKAFTPSKDNFSLAACTSDITRGTSSVAIAGFSNTSISIVFPPRNFVIFHYSCLCVWLVCIVIWLIESLHLSWLSQNGRVQCLLVSSCI